MAAVLRAVDLRAVDFLAPDLRAVDFLLLGFEGDAAFVAFLAVFFAVLTAFLAVFLAALVAFLAVLVAVLRAFVAVDFEAAFLRVPVDFFRDEDFFAAEDLRAELVLRFFDAVLFFAREGERFFVAAMRELKHNRRTQIKG